jgi:lipopolysaccharide transport system ATP-binding protein
MSTAIKVENLSKIYRLGEIGTGTISKDVQRWFTTKVRGKEDPFLKIGQVNDRTAKSSVDDIVYSLQNINFEINQGDAVGIIGRNGAGKSTLLKILSRVTSPTTGKINIKGRVASLLEVGTGFHPELTGRENIYLNGAILGMRKKEITRKLDEIIDFSGVERYIDTPVKRYSSGMYVRLAFAVAAHLESEILIVDEVLAVGDAEFQKKCLGKMGDVSKGEGRTVLFVSHNMASLSNICERGIVLNAGEVFDDTDIHRSILKYQSMIAREGEDFTTVEGRDITLTQLEIAENTNNRLFNMKEDIVINLSYNLHKRMQSLQCVVHLWTISGIHVMSTADIDFDAIEMSKEQGTHNYSLVIPGNLLAPNKYRITLAAGVPNLELLLETQTGPVFEVSDINSFASKWSAARKDVVIATKTNWKKI